MISMRFLSACLLSGLSSSLVLFHSLQAATVWKEGEDFRESTALHHVWYGGQIDFSKLSGEGFVSHWDAGLPAEIEYAVKIPETAQYNFWVRANPTQSKLAYKLGSGDWVRIFTNSATDRVNIAGDGANDLRHVGWMNLGKVELKEGNLRITFLMDSENNNHGSIDAFTLTTERFIPAGTMKPGEGGELELATEEGAWAFEWAPDPFSEDALLDLRWLNERESGETGFVRLSDNGMGFVRGDGQPIRFWSAVGGMVGKDPRAQEAHFRWLAKLGVNMVRLHQNVAGKKEGQAITEVNEGQIDGIFRAVAAAKKAGIYVTLSPYWYHAGMPASWENALSGWKKGQRPTGSLFFNPVFIDAYKGWVKELYTRKNPYTGLAIKDDPTVAILQTKNEDSLLFYTAANLPPEQKAILGAQFAEWLKEKYGSFDDAIAAWSAFVVQGDDFQNEIVAIDIPWHYTQTYSSGREQRINDQFEFMAKTQRDFYAEIDRYLKEELGVRQITNSMNWKSVDKLKTDDVERWTYTAQDVIAVNRYTGASRHLGENNGYRIDPGHFTTVDSPLRKPLGLPFDLKQPDGHPMIITESAWVKPARYQSEGPFLTAAYLSLTGVDSLYWFAYGQPGYQTDPRRKFWSVVPGEETGYAIDKWGGDHPMQAGLLPANALIHRLGYVQEGQPVVREVRSLEAMFARQHPIIAETETFDPNRDTQDLRSQSGGDATDVSRLAFLVGPVHLEFGGDPKETEVADLSPYIDPALGVVKSNTGELMLNYKTGFATMETSRAQGVAGFLKDAGGRFILQDVAILSENEYAAIQVVSMDRQPLSQSKQVLVQVGTQAKLTGWAERETTVTDGDARFPGYEIVRTGEPPYQIKRTQATVALKNNNLTEAVVLDTAGYPRETLSLNRIPSGVTLELPPDALYVILR
ncbi:MAG: hypothetical protein ACFBZ8_13135 [Opitutales bacterium]